MKPLILGANHLLVPMFPWGMNQRWNDIWRESYMNCGYEIKWSYDPRSYERNFCNCVKKPEKFRTSTGLRRSNQLSYEATDVGSWSFVGSNVPVRNESTGTLEPTNDKAPNVSGFIAQLIRASHRYHEVTGSNPVEVLNFSGFFMQLQKLRS